MPRKPRPTSLVSTDEDFVQNLRDRVRANPGDVDALAALGVWLLARDQPDKALDCFHRVTRKDARYPGIWRLKAYAFDALGDAKSAAMCRARETDGHD